MIFKILLSFKRYSDNDLSAFASDIVDNMKDNPVYEAEAARVTAISQTLAIFNQAMAKASDGGRTLKRIRNEKRELLLGEMVLLVTQLSLYADKDSSFFTATGFLLRKTPTRHEGPLPKAVLRYIRRGVLSGSVDGETDSFPDPVKQIAVEYSMDNGQSWQNGTYSTGKRFTVTGLPTKTDCQLRVCYHGTRQRTGDWSEPLGVFVL